jgi:GNAT superfamily N-acetyltransferase
VKIRIGTTEEAVALAKRMPDFSNPYNLNAPDTPLPRLDHVLIAEQDGEPIGFRAGYHHSAETFAVWLAGVLPEHRRQGIGGELYRRQKEWLKAQGYRFLRTHVRNSNRLMLQILIEHGYQVVDLVRYDDPQRNKIVFVKSLGSASPSPASSLVVGLLRASQLIEDRCLWSKLRDLTLSWLRFKYRGRVIEDSSADAILNRASESGYKYCLLLNCGSIVSHAWQLGFVRTLEDWANAQDFLVAGEIFEAENGGSGISSHVLLVNVDRYNEISRPALDHDLGEQSDGALTAAFAGGNFLESAFVVGPALRLPAMMTESILDVRPTSAEQAALVKRTFGMQIATADLATDELTLAQQKFLTAVQRQVQNSRKGIFVWNFESYDDVTSVAEAAQPVSTIFSVAAGLKTSWILEARGFDEQTKIVYFDYSEQALAFKRLLHSEWNGENYPDFLRYLFRKIQPGEAFYQLWGGLSPESISWDAVEETWQQELAKWGGEPVLKDHWRRARNLRVEYVLCNLLEDQQPLVDRLDNRPNSIIWWSNVFFTFFSNWCYTLEERREIYSRFIRGVAERSPRTLIFGNDYNNMLINGIPSGEYADVYLQAEDDYLEPRLIRG